MNDAQQIAGRWQHAPEHRLGGTGAFMVTCGTLRKESVLNTPERLTEFQGLLFKYAKKFGWRLQAWAVMSNHYHWVGLSPLDQDHAQSLKMMTAQLHEVSTKRLNREDGIKGRRIWYNYWDAQITFETSYYARLKYVHDNPVHHGVVLNASNYEWCSRPWLEQTANSAFIKELDSFGTAKLEVNDDF